MSKKNDEVFFSTTLRVPENVKIMSDEIAKYYKDEGITLSGNSVMISLIVAKHKELKSKKLI